ncbi:MAG: amidohydrolase family protein [Gemmatimonadaceae bacterium]|nr:amidohydrolase family protein [Gemmatimonadaceae bacterium]
MTARARALITLVLFLATAFPTLAQVTVIKAGKLIDTDRGTVASNQIILIRDGKIEDVGPSVSIPAGARVIDLSKMTVLPGLIDNHTHLSDGVFESDGDPRVVLYHTKSDDVLAAIPNLRTTLMSGFTTVRDVGTYRALNDVGIRDAIARGDIVGPRMYVAGGYITITGGAGSFSGVSPDVQLPWDMHYGEANSPDEVRQKVRLFAAAGVNEIKILSTGAVLTHGSNKQAQEFTPAELAAAVDEAHSFGLKVAAHAHNAIGIKNAVRAGVASIEHGTYLDDEAARLMKEHGTSLSATLEVHECIAGNPATPVDFQQHNDGIADIHYAGFRRAVLAGVKIAFSTDVPVCPYKDAAKEFSYMVKYGMTPMQAIQAATVGGAELIGVLDKLGSIKKGKLADIIAVSGDPTHDVKILENVEFVMKEGTVYKNTGVVTAVQ